MFEKPKLYSAKIIGKVQLNSRTVLLNVTPVSTAIPFNYKPGQYVSIKLGDKYRAYSIADYSVGTDTPGPNHSPISNPEVFSLIATTSHDGIGANFFKNAQVGDLFEFVGPSGKFLLDTNMPTYINFIATGTGIVPLFTMLNQLTKINPDSTIRLYLGFRHEDDVFFLNELDYFKKELSDFDYNICISQPLKSLTAEKYVKGRVTDVARLDNAEESHYYVCGNPEMVEDVVNTLLENNVKEADIYREKYTIAGN